MSLRPLLSLLLLLPFSVGCAAPTSDDQAAALAPDDEGPVGTTAEALVQTNPGYLYPRSTGDFYFKHLTGGALCEYGTYETSCLVDRLDWRLMPQLSAAKILELTTRIRSADANIANASVIVVGQWNIVTVRDHRVPGRNYRRVDFQVLQAYEANETGTHVPTFYRLSGTTAQRAQLASATHSLPFWATVDFPVPIITNSYGVVSDGYVTGTIVDPTVTPREISADRYFRRL